MMEAAGVGPSVGHAAERVERPGAGLGNDRCKPGHGDRRAW